VDPESGRLSLAAHARSGGRTPRSFVIDPEGRFVLVANQGSDNIVTLAIDQRTGALEDTGHRAEVPAPVCLKLHRPPR
jgi:6-phosphogluconolactonase